MLASSLGGLVTLMGKFLIDYRKAADAGKLAIIEVQQRGLQNEVARLQQHTLACNEQNKKCEENCAELRGQLQVLQVQVTRDVRDTLDLAERHGHSEARIGAVEKKLNGGDRP